MSRWLVLAAFSMALPLVGCGSSLRAGLSNAPRLGGTTTADNRVGDAVSNGDDACGAYAENGALRNRIPPARAGRRRIRSPAPRCPCLPAERPAAASYSRG